MAEAIYQVVLGIHVTPKEETIIGLKLLTKFKNLDKFVCQKHRNDYTLGSVEVIKLNRDHFTIEHFVSPLVLGSDSIRDPLYEKHRKHINCVMKSVLMSNEFVMELEISEAFHRDMKSNDSGKKVYTVITHKEHELKLIPLIDF